MTDPVEAAVAALVAALEEKIEAKFAAGPAPDRLMSLPEVCDLTGLSRTKIYSEIYAGRLRVVRPGRRVLIPASALTEWMERAG